ncbi:MAG: tripartite tricarboxylate transporter substrate-binding protein, partial [Desulfitobacterium hafniense]|nr:tripartite tricarboxylate transporter substrate-binding protein [Desulfitobacterium hafniense]
ILNLDFNKKFGTKLKSVQFAGTSEALTAVLGGHVDVLSVRVSEVLQSIKDGQLKAVAVTTKDRDPKLPNIPTIKEATGTEIINYTVRGVGAPKGLDPQVLAKLQAAAEKAMKNPDHIKKLEDMGLRLTYMSGPDFKKSLVTEKENILSYKDVLGW